MDINELIAKRARAWENAKEFLNTHGEDGVLNAEDSATYDKMEAEINNLGAAIQRAERAAKLDDQINASMAQPTTEPILNNPAQTMNKVGRASEEYRQACLTALRTKFKTVNDYLSEGTDTDGGYLVPEVWDKRLIDVLEEENIMRALGTVINTTSTTRINVAANKPAAAWVEEGQSLTYGDATFGQLTLDAYKLVAGVQVTEELLYDEAYDLEGYLITQFGKAIANAEEDAFLNGSGTKQPTGLFTKATEAVTGAISGDNLIDLTYALKRPYRKNAAFILADANMAAIRKLKDNNGQYIWTPAYALGEPDTILGFKAYTSAYAPTDKIAFGDYSYYNIGDRGNRSFQELREHYAEQGLVGYIAKERVDGILLLAEAVQMLSISGSSDSSDEEAAQG